MKFGIVVVLALVAGAFAAHFLQQDPGYVAIHFRGYVVEMSVPVLVLAVLLLLGAVWLAVRLLRMPRRLGEAAGRYRSGRAGHRLTRGISEIAEGNFARGEKLLTRAASRSEAPLANYLQAARAAHLLGEDERRDGWLRLAYEQTPEAASAVLLTQAELQLDQGQYEPALATLRRLEEQVPDHSQALNLLGRLYYRLGDWKQLDELLPRLRKHGRLEPSLLDRWSVRVQQEKLAAAADPGALAAVWQQTPKHLRTHLALLEAYVAALIRNGEHDKAEKALIRELKREWRGPLVRLFGLVEAPDPAKQLKRAEDWLTAHPDDVDLLLTAARLCIRNELWGKARSYLETALTLEPSPETYRDYGQLLARLGEGDAAAEAWRAGLGLVTAAPLAAIPDLRK